MKANYFLGNEQFEVREEAVPEIGADDVLVKVAACGICGTDVHIYHGDKGSAAVHPPVVLGHEGTVCDAQWPAWNEDYLKESTIKYTVLFKGRPRYNIEVPAGTDAAEVERLALAHEGAAKWLEGKAPKKVIVVPNKIVNVVI